LKETTKLVGDIQAEEFGRKESVFSDLKLRVDFSWRPVDESRTATV
jgi:hypothetical protein